MALLHLILLLSVPFCRPAFPVPITQTEPSYKSDPDGRGTVSLLWSCTITFGLCIWTAIHPHVVPWPGFWDKIYYRLCWMAFAVLLPEFILLSAVAQLIRARQILRCWRQEFESFPDPSVKDWLGMPGAFFVVMGGFVVQENKVKIETATTKHSGSGDTPPTVRSETQNSCGSSPHGRDADLVTTICRTGFEELLKRKIIHEGIRQGKLTEAHFHSDTIEDKGKADGIAKFLVSIQILWMVVQSLGRKLTGLPVTLLEIHVLIQIPYAIIAYICWWNKPLDAAEPIVLPLDAVQPAALGHDIHHESAHFSLCPWFVTEQRHRGGVIRMFWRAAYDMAAIVGADYGDRVEVWATVIGIINGGLHAAAWASHFPSGAEQLLWRIASIGAGAMPLLLCMVAVGNDGDLYAIWGFYEICFADKGVRDAFLETIWRLVKGRHVNGVPHERKTGFPTWLPTWARLLACGTVLFALSGYLLCVMYLLIESFVSVRSLPKGAYSSLEWSSLFPHI